VRAPWPIQTDFFIGLSLGDAGQPTGVVAVERRAERDVDGFLLNPTYTIPNFKSYPPETSYRRITTEVIANLERAPKGTCLVIDRTAVGDQIVAEIGCLVPAHASCNQFRVAPDRATSRANLIAVVRVLLEKKNLKINAELAETALLLRELRSFGKRPLLSTPDPFAWRVREHDDLVLAAAIALWYASHPYSLQPLMIYAR
jgi:hypothetical protein